MWFVHENDFDGIVGQAAEAWGVDVSLIKAIIGAESEFNPNAYRDEPSIGDASYGLMQLLYQTAKAIGYTGSTSGLFDPTTNIRLGTRYLANLIKTATQRGYGVDSAISAYNAGFSTVRPGDGKRVTNEPGSPFINQAYVDKVIRLANYYEHGSAQPLETVTVLGKAVENVSLWSLITFAIPLLLLVVHKKPSGRKKSHG